MFSLVMFTIIGAYFLLVWFVAWMFRGIALSIKKDKVVGRWGALIGALTVLLPVFWDVPPTVIAHRYYCATDAGVWVYKTPEQWYAERTITIPELPPKIVETKEDRLRSFKWEEPALLKNGLDIESQKTPVFLSVELKRWRIVDQNTFEVLAENRDYAAFNSQGNYKRLIFAKPFCSYGKKNSPNFAEITEEFKQSGYKK